MNDFLARIRALDCKFNPPCRPILRQMLLETLGEDINPIVMGFYDDHDGMDRAGSFPMRFMSIFEVVDRLLHTMAHPQHGFHVFWTDDNSNYAALYIDGPMRGKVCFLDHEMFTGPDWVPQYRSLENFLNTALAAAQVEQTWYEMPRDYPTMQPSPETDPEDRAAALELAGYFDAYPLTANWRDNYNRRAYFGHCAMNLFPFMDVEPYYKFARDRDMFLQERACEILGMRRRAEAIPLLSEIAQTGLPNGRGAAIGALVQIGNEEARITLLKLYDILPQSAKPQLSRALAALDASK